MMYIVELNYPGTWLDYPDPEWSCEVEQLLMMFESSLAEAAIALTWFEEEKTKIRTLPNRSEWEAEGQRLSEIKKRLANELGVERFDFQKHEEIRLRAELEIKREMWSQGRMPYLYEQRMIFMHAKAFLFALDRIEKLIGALCQMPNIPSEVSEAKAEFQAAVPNLRGVRNSVAHYEDRVRGIGRKGKRLQMKPVDNLIAKATKGAIILESLVNNRFVSTMGDGECGEVEVSARTLDTVTGAIQHILFSFQWKGLANHWPR